MTDHGHSHGGSHGHSHGDAHGHAHGDLHGHGGHGHGEGHSGSHEEVDAFDGLVPSQMDLKDAVIYNVFERVKELVESKGVKPDSPDEDGHMPLHWAALNGCNEVLEYLITKGATVDAVEPTNKQTPLHWAVIRGHLDTVLLLEKHNADVHKRDGRNGAAVHYAAEYGMTGLVLHMLQQGSAVDDPDGDGHTPLHWAAWGGHAITARRLLLNQADISRADLGGCTALHWAAARGHFEVASMLVEQSDAELLALDKNGNTPAMLAIQHSHASLARLLQSKEEAKLKAFAFNRSSVPRYILLLVFFVAHPLFWVSVLPTSSIILAISSLLLFVLSGYFYQRASRSDPGYLPLTSADERTAHTLSALVSLCKTCNVPKPLRSAHCDVCTRCVARFSFHSIWLKNCVGVGNQASYFGFLVFHFVDVLLTFLSLTLFINSDKALPAVSSFGSWLTYLIFEHRFLFLLQFFLFVELWPLSFHTFRMVWLVLNNLTLHESIHWAKYPYFISEGRFHNPFSKGAWANVGFFLGLHSDFDWRSVTHSSHSLATSTTPLLV